VLPVTSNQKTPNSLAPILKTTLPAVVNISVEGQVKLSSLLSNRPSANTDNSQQFRDVGSGVIVDADKGYIITNAHVLKDAKIITVTLGDGRRYRGNIIGQDDGSDVAVIQIHAKHLTALPFANSDELQVGDFVAAIGNPFGLHQTVTSGVISALNRSDLGIEGYENFIQTDAPINPGNSGGALINLAGQLIGINTAIIAPTSGSVGIGFAIPSNMVHAVAVQLIQFGKVKRGLLGVMVQKISPDLADALGLPNDKGALVTSVNPGSPAAEAGLQELDVVTAINGNPVTNAAHLRNAVAVLPIGTVFKLQVWRKGKIMNVAAKVGDPMVVEKHQATIINPLISGIRLVAYDSMDSNEKQIKGLGVLEVANTSSAWLGGLQPGDIIIEANDKPTLTFDALKQAAAINSEQLLLKVWRDGGVVYLVVNR